MVENARAMALDVEQKVASANVFAEQVRWHRLVCRWLQAWVLKQPQATGASTCCLQTRSCSYSAQVGAEKEKVNAENESAKVEADKCAEIAKEVSEKQASCERDLAAAEPLVQQAEAALDTLNKKDLGETKSLKKPPPGVLKVLRLHPARRYCGRGCWREAHV